MSLANIQGKLSRAEMKKIMAGSGGGFGCSQELDFCGWNQGVEYKCCTGAPQLTCVNNLSKTS